jgi:4-amino-4-deoxy-L-arabinose transferase-like glycosyltransferase
VAATILDGRPTRGVRKAEVHFWLSLLAICTLALAIRVGYTWLQRGTAPLGDGLGYLFQSRQLLAGKGFINPLNGHKDAIHPPAWVLALTGARALGLDSRYQLQMLAAVVGTATVALVGFAGRKLAGFRTGLVAAGLAALYPGLWLYERALLSETLVLPLIALTIVLVYRFRERPGLTQALGLGAMVALLASTRSEQILIAPLVVMPAILSARRAGDDHRVPWRDRLVWLGAAGAVAVVMLAPWTIYNLGRFDHPVLLSNGFNGATGVATCDVAFYGPKTGNYDLACLVRDPAGHTKGPYLRAHLGRLPLVVVAREGRTFNFWAPFQQAELDSNWDSNPLGVHQAAVFSFWLVALPAAAGGVILRRRKVPIYPLLGFVLTVVITVAVTFGEPRYRVPADIPILLLAAVAIDAAIRRRARDLPDPPGDTPPSEPDDPPGRPLDQATWSLDFQPAGGGPVRPTPDT